MTTSGFLMSIRLSLSKKIYVHQGSQSHTQHLSQSQISCPSAVATDITDAKFSHYNPALSRYSSSFLKHDVLQIIQYTNQQVVCTPLNLPLLRGD